VVCVVYREVSLLGCMMKGTKECHPLGPICGYRIAVPTEPMFLFNVKELVKRGEVSVVVVAVLCTLWIDLMVSPSLRDISSMCCLGSLMTSYVSW